jgi:hypothetical protein
VWGKAWMGTEPESIALICKTPQRKGRPPTPCPSLSTSGRLRPVPALFSYGHMADTDPMPDPESPEWTIVWTIKRELRVHWGPKFKRLTDPYVSGRTGIWTKAKCRATQHAWIGGWTYSDKGFSGLLLGVYRGKKLIPIGRVGTGFPRRLLDWLEPRLKQIEIKDSPFSEPIPRKPNREVHWAKPELIAGIEMTSWTQDRVIRQASLQEVRERKDKTLRPDWINLPE